MRGRTRGVSSRYKLTRGAAGEAKVAGARQVARNVGLQYSGRVVGLLVSLATLPLIARTLGADGFGVYSSTLAYVLIFATISEFGLTSAATMRMAADPEHEAEWLGALASLRTLVSVVAVVLCAGAVPLVFDGREARITALILSVTILFSGAGALMSVFFARLRGAVPLAISLFENALWLALVIALATASADPILVAAAYVLLRGTIAVTQIRATRGMAATRTRATRHRWRPLLQIAVPTGLAYVFMTIYFNIAQVLLLGMAGEEEAGIYGAAYRFLMPLLFLPQAVMGAIFPVMSAAGASDAARLNRIVQRATDYLAISTLPVLAVFAVLSGPVVAVILGDDFVRTATVLPILMIAYVAIGFGTLAGFLAPILGLQWRLTAYAAIGAAANLGLNVLLIPTYGAVGSAWATVATEGLTMALMYVTCLRRLRFRPSSRNLLATSAAAGAMALAMLAARPVGLIPALVAGGAVYVAGLLLLRAVRIDDLRAVLKR